MATKKATKKSSSTTRKAAPSKPTTTKVRTVTAKDTSPRKTATAASKSTVKPAVAARTGQRIDSNVMNIVIAELVGTFVLVLVALLSFQETLPLYLGLTFAVLFMAIGAVSGAHLNPAVSFGLWAVNRVKTLMVPFYWAAQLLGGMAAVVVVNLVSGNKLNLDFGHFGNFSWGMFSVELVGTAVFLFGLVAVLSRLDLSATSKALGVGLSFTVGLLVAGTLFANLQAGIDSSQATVETDETTGQQRVVNLPREISINGATLNPAIALASTEKTDSQVLGGQATAEESMYTRLGWEVIIATLLGGALGANLARLVNYRFTTNNK